MTENDQLLALQFSSDWTEGELNQLMEAVDGFVDDDTDVVAVPEDIEFLTRSEVEQLTNQLEDTIN